MTCLFRFIFTSLLSNHKFLHFRYRQHKTDFQTIPSERPILQPCQVRGCKCVSYAYIPGMHIRCRCKHPSQDHSVVEPNKCKKGESIETAEFKIKSYFAHDSKQATKKLKSSCPQTFQMIYTCIFCQKKKKF